MFVHSAVHGRNGEPVRWIQQRSPCHGQQRRYEQSSSRQNRADRETWDSNSIKLMLKRVVNQEVRITDHIKRNNIHLFSHPPVREKPRKQLQMSSIKKDCLLFSRLYIASQIWHGDLDEFFQHENQACPPSLSQMGGLRTGTNSEPTPCLENLIPVKGDLTTPKVLVIIMDVAANHYHAKTRECQDITKLRQWCFCAFCHISASVLRQTRRCLGSLHGKHLEVGDSQQEREGSSLNVEFLETGKSFSSNTKLNGVVQLPGF